MSLVETKTKSAAAYLRCSTVKQEASIQDQGISIDRFADDEGYSIVARYVDEGVSGTNFSKRPEFQRLIRDAQSPDCPFQYLLVYDVSRFGRGDRDEIGHYRYKLRSQGIEIILVAEALTGTEIDPLILSTREYAASNQPKVTSRDTIRRYLGMAEAGTWPGGVPPYGYDLQYENARGEVLYTIRYLENGKKEMFVPSTKKPTTLDRGAKVYKSKFDNVRLVLSDPKRVELVQRVLEMYLNDKVGLRSIAAKLNEESIPSPRDGNWSKNTNACWSRGTIRSILMNHLYTGDLTWNRRTGGKVNQIKGGRAVERKIRVGSDPPVEWNDKAEWIVTKDAHPVIIPKEKFDKAQRIMKERGLGNNFDYRKMGRAKYSPYLLSGLIVCEHCDHKFSGQGRTLGEAPLGREQGQNVLLPVLRVPTKG